MLPLIDNYEDFVKFNANLAQKTSKTICIYGVSYSQNTIKVKDKEINIDRLLYKYATEQSFVLSGRVSRLKQYDFSRLHYLLHPEDKDKFADNLRAYLSNILLMGDEGGCQLWDFNLQLEGEDIVLKSCIKDKITEVFIPSFITKIGEHAFDGGCFYRMYQNIRRVVFENDSQIKCIGRDAFAHCKQLHDVTLPEGLEKINGGAFFDSGLTKLIIPSTVKIIGAVSFDSCTHLKELSFKDSIQLKKIGSEAFSGCWGLKHIVIPDSVEILGEAAFANCGGLESIVIGRGVVEIPCHLFLHDYSLAKINILGNIKKIENYAFEGIKLDLVVLPKGSTFKPSAKYLENCGVMIKRED